MSFRDDQMKRKLEAFDIYVQAGREINVDKIAVQTRLSRSIVRRLLAERGIATEAARRKQAALEAWKRSKP
jgi:hypothetical protein